MREFLERDRSIVVGEKRWKRLVVVRKNKGKRKKRNEKKGREEKSLCRNAELWLVGYFRATYRTLVIEEYLSEKGRGQVCLFKNGGPYVEKKKKMKRRKRERGKKTCYRRDFFFFFFFSFCFVRKCSRIISLPLSLSLSYFLKYAETYKIRIINLIPRSKLS